MVLPSDIKRRFLGKGAGDKEAIGYAMLQAIPNLGGCMAGLARGKHEHVYDAAALALMALEYHQNKLL